MFICMHVPPLSQPWLASGDDNVSKTHITTSHWYKIPSQHDSVCVQSTACLTACYRSVEEIHHPFSGQNYKWQVWVGLILRGSRGCWRGSKINRALPSRPTRTKGLVSATLFLALSLRKNTRLIACNGPYGKLPRLPWIRSFRQLSIDRFLTVTVAADCRR